MKMNVSASTRVLKNMSMKSKANIPNTLILTCKTTIKLLPNPHPMSPQPAQHVYVPSILWICNMLESTVSPGSIGCGLRRMEKM
jgi:hypothetical protein